MKRKFLFIVLFIFTALLTAEEFHGFFVDDRKSFKENQDLLLKNGWSMKYDKETKLYIFNNDDAELFDLPLKSLQLSVQDDYIIGGLVFFKEDTSYIYCVFNDILNFFKKINLPIKYESDIEIINREEFYHSKISGEKDNLLVYFELLVDSYNTDCNLTPAWVHNHN